MKKEVLSAIGALLVAGLLLLLVLLPRDTSPPDTTGPTPPIAGTTFPNSTPGATTIPTTRPTFGTTAPTPPATTLPTPPETTVPTIPETTVPPPPTTLPPEPGVVRLYTCDSRLQEIYVELAADFYAKTGTEVIVLSPSGDNCEETLTALLAEDHAPTIFCIHTEQMLQQLKNGLYDLSGTYAATQLYGNAFAQIVDGKTVALAADVAGSGLIYNASKLASAAWTDEDLVDFEMLKVAVDSIKSNKGYAFAAPDFTDTHLMEHLAGLYTDAAQLRSFIDLYVQNSTSKSTTLAYFLNGTTVFYIGSTRDYEQVAPLGSANLRFLPAYAQESTAVQCFSDHYWAVSGVASPADTEATLAFLDYLVTPQEHGIPADALGLLLPFRGATHNGNVLEEKLRTYMVTGNVYVTWTVSGKVSDISAFTAALKAYKSSATDANWSKIAALFGDE